MSTPTSCMIGRNHPLMHLKGTQPPLIAVPVVFVPRRELPRIHIIPGRVCDPLFADDLFSLPAATVQKELADLCHIPWPQNKTAPRIQNTPAPLQPAVVRYSKGIKQEAFGKLPRGVVMCPRWEYGISNQR